MPDVAREPTPLAPLELLRAQRSRLADRIRPPWWYLAGVGFLWALVFAGPFGSHYLSRAFITWPILAIGLPLAFLLQWGMTRTTGMKTGFRDLSYRPGRPAGITMLVVSIVATGFEHYLLDRGLPAVAIVVAVVAVVAVAAEVAAQLAMLRAIRRAVRAGEGSA
jgi:hypothetical protein